MAENGLVHRLITALWRSLRGSLQWRILYLVHARFMVGVTVACWNEGGEVLLVRHRFWPAEHPWGLPSGYARRGEELATTAQREVREEAGYEIAADPAPVDVTSGYKLRIEVLLNGAIIGGDRHLNTTEIEDAGFFTPDEIPDAILPSHRDKIERARVARQQR
jgi:8-oxo-dGTP diphosphatase